MNPFGRIGTPEGLERDLSGVRGGLPVKVFIGPLHRGSLVTQQPIKPRGLNWSPRPIPATAVFDKLVDSVACYERDGTIVYVNPATCRVLGQPSDELVGRNLWELLPDARGNQFHLAFESVCRSGEAVHFETLSTRLSRWFESHVYLVEDRVWVVGRDTTDKKLASARLEILANATRSFSQAASNSRTLFDTIACDVAAVIRDGCVIRLLSLDGRTFDAPVGVWDSDPEILEVLRQAAPVNASEGAGGEILRTGRAVILATVDPVAVAERIAPPDRRESTAGIGIHSIMIVPLKAQGQILGIISLLRRRGGTARSYTDSDLRLLEELADRAALVVKQRRALTLEEESRQRLTVIGDALPALVSLVGRDETYQFVNATYEKWFGYDRSAVLGKTMREVLGADAYAAIEPHVRKALAGENVNYQAKLHYASGGTRDVEASYTPYVVDGQVQGFIALVVDVSARVRLTEEREALLVREHQARDLAERREERLRHLVEGSPYAIAMLDRSMNYLFASQRWLTEFRLNLTLDEIRGRSHYAVFPEIPDHWKESHRRCLAGEMLGNDAEAFVRADGTIHWIRWEIRPWTDDRGKIGGILIFSEDISAKKRTEDELKAAIAVRDEFLSIASHELRTPLTTLQLQLDGVQRLFVHDVENASREKIARKVGIAVKQADHLTELIDGLLNVSRIAMGTFSLEVQDFDLASLMQEVFERFEEEANQAGSTMVLHVPASVPVRWDRARIDQALTNVLSNAIKYGPGKPIDVSTSTDGDQVAIAVHDSGIGIAEKDVPRIFGRFERAVSSRNYGGMGLGLYIANQIVTAHGGTIEVESHPVEGTVFTIRLPRFQ